jgi:hypothetical protein
MADKVKIKDIKSGAILEVFTIDAKESVDTGRYEYYTGTAAKKPTKAAAPAKPDDSEDEPEVITAKDIKGMNTEELNEFVKDNEVEIEGFDDLNLKDKRKALIEYIESEEDASEDEEENEEE